MPSVSAEDLTAFAIAAYEAAGTPPEHAQIVSRHQVGANLVGHDSHGVVLLPTYIDRIGRGHIVPVARPEILNESPTTLAVNGRWGSARSSRSGRWSVSLPRRGRRESRRERFASRATSGGSPTIR